MPLMKITVPHQLGQDKATERLKRKHEEIKQQHTYTVTDLTETWSDPHSMEFAFKVLGFSLTGSVQSFNDSVKISVDLPVAAILMKHTIESQIRKELVQVLS
ncbi:MAG: polyhydroxyalkanoic acid system family protein [Planctomycetaceae bacterium]|nr:polyhydroxyalkanoic acid system family protein [Planctomycetaceae bacterium]